QGGGSPVRGGTLAREHLEEDEAQRVEVRAVVRGAPPGLLRREVGQRPENGSRTRQPLAALMEGETEVHEDRVPRAVHHDVSGLEVAVDDAALVDGLEPGADLP